MTTLLKRGRAPVYADAGVLVVSQKCVRAGNQFDVSVARRSNVDVKPVPPWALLRAGDVLVNSTGRGTLGRACLVPELPEAATADSHVSIVRADVRQILPDFLGMTLSMRQGDMEALQAGSTNQTELSPAALGSLLVSVPPLPVQRRIVGLIGALDVHVSRLTDEARCSHDVLSALTSSELNGLQGVRHLEAVMAAVRSGGTPSRKNPLFYGGDIPWLKSGEVANAWLVQTEERVTQTGLDQSSAWLVPSGSVVVAMYGATAAEVGYLAAPMATNQAVLALVPDPKECDGRFAYHWFRHHAARLKRAASGAAQPNLSKAVILREVSFPALDMSRQRHIGQLLDTVQRNAAYLRAEASALRDYRERLLIGLLSANVTLSASYDDSFLSEAV